MSCDDASPGVCFLGQLGFGTFFGCCFGTVTNGLYGDHWWGGAPGVIMGSTMGILAARNPDAMPDTATFLLVVVPVTVVSLYVLEFNQILCCVSVIIFR
jgi:hypothetical protein